MIVAATKLKTHSCLLFSIVLLTLALSTTAFSQSEKKTAYGVLIDNSGSLRSQFPLVIGLAKGIVDRAHTRGPVSLFPFNSVSKNYKEGLIAVVGIDWSQDKALLDKYLDSIFVVPGQTTLSDGLAFVATHLDARIKADKEAYGEKIIFLISDGEERVSHLTQEDLIKKLKAAGIKVYAIGLVQELDDVGGRPTKGKAVSFLERVTRETGGRAVIPKSKKFDVEAVLNELFVQ